MSGDLSHSTNMLEQTLPAPAPRATMPCSASSGSAKASAKSLSDVNNRGSEPAQQFFRGEPGPEASCLAAAGHYRVSRGRRGAIQAKVLREREAMPGSMMQRKFGRPAALLQQAW
jgi:hypothetical protein